MHNSILFKTISDNRPVVLYHRPRYFYLDPIVAYHENVEITLTLGVGQRTQERMIPSARSKVVGALCNPKGLREERYVPRWVVNTASSRSFLAMRTFQYPNNASIDVSTFYLPRLWMKSSSCIPDRCRVSLR